MDLVAAAAAALEASSNSTSPQKRPINYTSNYGSNYNHHQHSHNHNDRRKNMPMMGHLDSWRIDKGLETQSMSNADRYLQSERVKVNKWTETSMTQSVLR